MRMKLHEIILRRVRLPPLRPYLLSYRTFTEFEPIVVEIRDADGRVVWGEGHISPGSSVETREGGGPSAASTPVESSTPIQRRRSAAYLPP
jgi:L-alanine-DL-glutamate epimerase-like enolase superfamily enzyme